jgi:signal transduction histidine kinase/CheY-like chemotaxis protein/HPt (histidine-containing phosphotransfer) domain-containing protein
MAVIMGPANAESDHLIDVERADPVDVAPSALAAEAEILRELREALDYRTAMSEILRVISGSAFDLTSVLLTVLTNAKTLCRADMAGLYRYQDGAYRFAVGDGLLPAYERTERRQVIRPGPGTIVGWAALERRTVQITDAWTDPRYSRKKDARAGKVRCMIGVPLLREGMPIGVIGLARERVEPYTQREIETVSTFAHQAVIAIENVRLFEELQAARKAAERERDIAERARAEAEAANRAKSTFLAAMSHEIRTPMNGVLGMMDVLERSSLEPAQERNVAVMRQSAQGLLRIIDDVLDFSKIDAGRMDIEAAPFSLSELVAATVKTMMPQARRKHLRLSAEPSGAGPDRVIGDPTRVRQILFNLVGNAIKFTDQGFVRIHAVSRAQRDGSVLVSLMVADSGIGMDETTRARLFEPFMQADSSTTRRFGGTGLGLSIVRRLAQLMGGDVDVETAPGEGARFTVHLRLSETRPAALADIKGDKLPPSFPPWATAARLLVADDHPVNLEVILRQLELLGLSAETAEDGATALVKWRKAPHDVILLDLHMPVLDGFGLAKAIRHEEAKRGLPRTALVAVTADAMKGKDARCYAAGMDGFVTKPVSIDALARTLGRWVPNLVAMPAPGRALNGALFDPKALRILFGSDASKLAGHVQNFADSVKRDIAALHAAPEAKQVAAFAHRLRGAARVAGATLMAEQAARVEAAAEGHDLAGARCAAVGMEELLADTLEAMRSVA